MKIAQICKNYKSNLHWLFSKHSKRSDYDDDCLEGLVCWEGDGGGKAPGCSGTPQVDWDYCVDPNATQVVEPHSNEPLLTEKPKMNVCEGDWWVKVEVKKRMLFMKTLMGNMQVMCLSNFTFMYTCDGLINHQLMTLPSYSHSRPRPQRLRWRLFGRSCLLARWNRYGTWLLRNATGRLWILYWSHCDTTESIHGEG